MAVLHRATPDPTTIGLLQRFVPERSWVTHDGPGQDEPGGLAAARA